MAVIDQQGSLRREANEWLARLTSGHATAADAEAAKRWTNQSPAHARALAEATLLWETLGPVARRVANRSVVAMPAGPRLGRRAVLGGALAASAAAVGYLAVRPPLAFWPSLSEIAADYRTGAGERRQIATADGVSVELNTRTSINIRPADESAHRIELISGEVAIATDGALAKPLVVAAGGGRLIATAAKFDVRCDGAAASVTCLQGAVRVEYRGRAVSLPERQQVSYGPDGLGSAAGVDPAVATAWREGRLVFHGMPLVQVIDEVNRYRRGRIILLNETLGRHSVEATVPLDRIDDLIILVQKAYGAKVAALPGGIVLLS